jgi:hypothetical protein
MPTFPRGEIMSHPRDVAAPRALLKAFFVLALAVLSIAPSASGEQSYVSRYDVITGYTFLDSPSVGLFDNGFHFQFGVRPKTWYSLGFDYSVSSGSLTLTPNLLTTASQQQLTGLFQELAAAGELPPGYSLVVPTHSFTQTFTGGPQLAYRHFSRITLFIRPSVGVIHEVATPHATDMIAALVISQLAPTGKKTDTTIFYGFGGGVDFILSKHVSIRVQDDLVYDHLFNNLLQKGEVTTRFSIGPCFNFGKNIRK